jgi:hypothetical protein
MAARCDKWRMEFGRSGWRWWTSGWLGGAGIAAVEQAAGRWGGGVAMQAVLPAPVAGWATGRGAAVVWRGGLGLRRARLGRAAGGRGSDGERRRAGNAGGVAGRMGRGGCGGRSGDEERGTSESICAWRPSCSRRSALRGTCVLVCVGGCAGEGPGSGPHFPLMPRAFLA